MLRARTDSITHWINDEVIVTGTTPTACSPPTITLGSNPTVCAGTTTSNLSYSATSNSPNQYSIVYDATALSAGFVNVSNATLPSSPITLSISPTTAAGTYNYTLTVKNSSTGCVSSGTAQTISINAPATVTPGGPDIANPSASPAAITLSGASVGGEASTGAWSIVSGGGTLSSTSQSSSPQNVTYTPAANYSGTVVLTLTSNSVVCSSASANRIININSTTSQSFVTAGSYSFTVPACVTSAVVECWGAGGGGGGNASMANGGGGGGGGAYSRSTFTMTPGTVYSVNVGAGGAAGVLANNGGNGGDTWFNTNTTILAKGGSQGLQQSGSTGGAGGAGGAASAGIGSVKYSGGAGATGVTSSIGTGGGGGASAGSGGNGGNAPTATTGYNAGGTAPTGGGAGGSDTYYTPGTAGTAPGGGGGGASILFVGSGGAGAAGAVTISWSNNLAISSNTVSPASICTGTSNVPIHSISLQGSNTCISDLSLVTTGTYTGSEISNFKLYYTNSNTFSTTNLLATISSPSAAGTQTFPAFSLQNNSSTQYLWITMDVASTLTDGHTIAVSTTSPSNITSAVTATGSASASGTQTLKTTATLNLTSAIGTNNQTKCINTAISAITYTVGGGGSGATVTGLPTGVTGTYTTGTVSISGTPSVSGTYHYTVSTTGICTQTVTTGTITVNTLPTVSVNNATICAGQTTTLTATAGLTSYSWSNLATTQSISVNPTLNTSYTVTGTNTNGCSASAVASVTVNALPTVSVNNATICTGQTTTLTATAGLTYLWSNLATTQSISVNPTSNTSYTVTGTNANGCSANAVSSVTVNALPTVIVNNATICSGQTATLTATGGATYGWSTGATTNTIIVNPTTNSSYTVTETSSSACSANAVASVTVNALPIVSVNNATICAGQTASLTATAGLTSYSWSNSATTQSITVNPASNTSYTVTGTNANNCSSSAVASVTVNALPTASVNNATICTGQTATLTATGGLTSYSWSNSATTQSITVSPTSTTSYTVTGTNANNCSANAVASVTVNALPTVIVNNATICSGQTATLTATGGSIYSWNTGTTTNEIIVNPSSNTSYTVTETSSSACSSSAVASVAVNPLPTVTVNNSTICTGQTTTLTATGGTTYLWSNLASTQSITVNPTSNTSYTVTGTNANGCSSSAVASVTVNALPTVIVNNSTICTGQTTTLTATGGTTYLWSNLASTQSITVNPTSNTSYTVTGTNANNCSASVVAIVTVNALPTVSVNNATICTGQTATLTATGGITYLWSTGATSASINVNPTTTSSYTVAETSSSGCSSNAVASVMVNALPSVTVNNATICTGQTVTLTATGGTTYLWSTGATSSSINVNPTTTSSYTVAETSSSGCSASAIASVTVNTLLIVSVNNVTICAGQTATLTATAGLTSYSWSDSATTSSITVNPTFNTSYTVTGTNLNGCSSSAVANVTVNSLPVLSVNSATICAGNVATLNVSGASTYLWSTGQTIASIIIYYPSTTTTYSVTGTTSGCSSMSTATVIVVPPLPSIAVGAAYNCSVQTLNLTVTTVPNSNYSWVGPNGFTSTIQNPIITNATTINSGTYTVTVSEVACSYTGTVNVLVSPSVSLQNSSFQKTYGGDGDEEAFCVKQTCDNGYIMCGSTTSFDAIGLDAYVVKTDMNGNLQWSKTLGGNYDQLLYSIEQASDGGYIATGYSTNAISSSSSTDAMIVKLDANGNTQWTKYSGGSLMDIGFVIKKLQDGNFVYANFFNCNDGGTSNINPYVEKMDINGNVIWSKQFDFAFYQQYLQGINEMPNGDLIFVGSATGGGNFGPHPGSIQYYDGLVVRLDKNGNLLKTYETGRVYDDGLYAAAISPKGSIYVAGGSWVNSNSNSNASYLKISPDFTSNVWTTFAENQNKNQGTWALDYTSNDMLISSIRNGDGYLQSNDAELLLLDTLGNKVWSRGYGGNAADEFNDSKQTFDGGYIAAGYSASFNSAGDRDIYLVKTDINGNTPNDQCGTTTVVHTITNPSLLSATTAIGYGNLGISNIETISPTTDVNSKVKQTCDYQCPTSFIATNNGPVCFGQTISAIATPVNGAAYTWAGPNGFTSTAQAPIITNNASTLNAGTYSVTLSKTGCSSVTATTQIEVLTPVTTSTISFQQTYGGDGDEEALDVKQTTCDDGYIICGSTTSFGAIGLDAYVVKTDVNGNLQWSKTLGGANDQILYSIEQTSDGGYIAAGYSTNAISSSSSTDAMIVKLDANGNTQWTKYSGAANQDIGFGIKKLQDGNFVYVNYFNGNTTDINPYIEKIDISGNTIWSRQLDFENYPQYFQGVTEMPNGNLIFVGAANGAGNFGPHPGVAQFYDGLVVKLDKNGNLLNTYETGGAFNDCFYAAAISPKGSVYVAGGFWVNRSTNLSASYAKISPDFTTNNWVTYAENQNINQSTSSLGYTSNDQLISAVTYGDYGTEDDAELLLLDTLGNKIWSKGYGGSASDVFRRCHQTSDGGYIAGGYTASYNSAGNRDIFLVKTDVNGNVPSNSCGTVNVTHTITHPSILSATTAIGAGYLIINDILTASPVTNVNSAVRPSCASPCQSNIAAGNNGPVCVGQPINITVPAVSGAMYSWAGPNGFISTAQAPVVTNSATTVNAGTYTVTITKAGCNTVMATTTVTVNVQTPPDQPVITTNSPVCSGNNILLNAASTVATYSWTGPNGFVSNQQNPTITVVTAANAGTYTLSLIVQGCAPSSNTVNVSINQSPNIRITPSSAQMCAGGSVSLTAGGGASYTWSTGQTAMIITVSPSTTTSYTLTGADVNGCVNTSVQSIMVNALPIVSSTVSPSATVCSGAGVTLSGTGALSYSWTGGITDGVSFVPASTATYRVVGTDANGCMNKATQTITVNSSPLVSVNSSTICAGQTATLTATGGTMYLWSTGATSASINVNPATTTSYTVAETSSSGCSANAVASVIVNTLPTISVNNATICAGQTGTLTATGAASYIWSTSETTQSITVNPTSSANYTVTGSINGCSATATSAVTASPLPVIIIPSPGPICIGANALLIVSGATSYTWTPAATLNTSSGAMVNATPTQSTTYTVVGTSATGCTDSKNITVEINPTCNVKCVTNN